MGQYVNLAASGPGPDLFYMETGAWTTDVTQAQVFLDVTAAQGTGIVGLPPGYHTKLVQSLVDVVGQEPAPPPCTTPIY